MLNRIIISFLVLAAYLCNGCGTESEMPDEKYVIGYLFPRDSIINEEKIAVEKLTHINYAFADIKGGEIKQGFINDSVNFSILNSAKKRNPELKILISIGGWTWSGQFSDVSLTKESRKKFVESSILFMQRHKLDGIDIDWEFPAIPGYEGNVYRPEDKQNFTYLMKDFREALDELEKKEGKHFLLTAATGSFDDYLENTEMGKVQQYLDFVNIMAYDFYESSYADVAGHHTALYTSPLDKRGASADEFVQKYIKEGVPANKIVLGVAFYGRAWEVTTTENNGLYQKAGAVKKPIHASFKNIKLNLENMNGYVRYWDSVSSAPFLLNEKEKIFITYDDEESLKAKCNYIKKHNLKGAMFWEYTSDHEATLLKTLYNELK
ncbi:MAG: glycoside hydrolase family 18 protein [Ignavibacteriaceae bacterium]